MILCCGPMTEADPGPVERSFRARTLAPGAGLGPVLLLDEPLSFWGGVDSASGRVIDGRHPQFGEALTGRIVLLPGGRGSSSSSSVLAEMVRARTAPAALILLRADPILALGAVVASELYGRAVPVVELAEEPYRTVDTGDVAAVDAVSGDAGVVRVWPGLTPPGRAGPGASR